MGTSTETKTANSLKNCSFELITPDNGHIEEFNGIWNSSTNAVESICLFENYGAFDISEYDCIKDNKYKDDDIRIGNLITKLKNCNYLTNYVIAVKELNKIYSTQIKGTEIVASQIFNGRNKLFDLLDNKKYIDAVNYIACINKKEGGSYLYSFATKLVNFLAQEGAEVPIFDSYSSTLICEFLKGKRQDVSHTKMGEYGYYCDQYKKFVKEYSIQKTYKEIDIFLWLYGKVLSEFWRRAGVITFTSVYYKDPSGNK